MSSYRDVKVGDLFTPTSGKPKYIKTYVADNPGEHPVYSASLREPFGHIDTFDYKGQYLTWVMNGYGGRVQEFSGEFSANRDRGVLVPKDGVKIPSLTYLRFALEPVLSQLAVGRRVDGGRNEYTKLYPDEAADAVLQLPLDDDGELDYSEMERVGNRLRRIEAIKRQISETEIELSRSELVFECPAPTVSISLADPARFRLSIGSRVLLSQAPVGGVPVYSANVLRPFGYVDEAAGLSFDRASLLWGIDGNFDWNHIPSGSEFLPTDHCGRAEILDDLLDPEYLLYALRSTRGEHGFDRVFRASLANLRREVSVIVPADDHGRPSLERQRALAAEHRALLDTKARSLAALSEVLAARLGLQS